MNKIINTCISFIFGVGIGGAFAYEYSKRKFSGRLDTEVKELKKFYSEREKQTKADILKNKPSLNEFVKDEQSDKSSDISNDPLTDKCNKEEMKERYVNYAQYYKSDEEKNVTTEVAATKTMKKPYIIPPEQFGSMGYSEISLTYYSDGILAEEGDSEKLPINETIGANNIKHIGEDAQDALYIRNDEKEIDYEILSVNEKYTDVFDDDSNEED